MVITAVSHSHSFRFPPSSSGVSQNRGFRTCQTSPRAHSIGPGHAFQRRHTLEKCLLLRIVQSVQIRCFRQKALGLHAVGPDNLVPGQKQVKVHDLTTEWFTAEQNRPTPYFAFFFVFAEVSKRSERSKVVCHGAATHPRTPRRAGFDHRSQ